MGRMSGHLQSEAAMSSILLSLILLASATSPTVAAQSTSEVASTLDKSLQPIYVAVEFILDLVQPASQSILITDLANNFMNSSSGATLNFAALSQQYAIAMIGYVIIACIGVLLILIMPIIFLIVFCCRCCCNKCTGYSTHSEHKGAGCKRVTYSILLGIFATIMLICTVLAFISNDLLRDKMEFTSNNYMPREFVGHLNTSAAILVDIPDTARSNSKPAIIALVDEVPLAVSRSMVRTRDYLADGAKATTNLNLAMSAVVYFSNSIALAQQYVDKFDAYNASLDEVGNMLGYLKSNLSSVSSTNCPYNAISGDCGIIDYNLKELVLTQTSNKAGNGSILELLNLLQQVNDTQVRIELESAQEKLRNITTVGINLLQSKVASVQNTLNSTEKLEEVWNAAENLFDNVAQAVVNLSNLLNTTVNNQITGEKQTVAALLTYIDSWRYYAYFAVCCVSALVIVFFAFGLMYGCGERPIEDSGCCNKGVGAKFLLVGTVIGCIVFSVVGIFVLAAFLVGAGVDTELCRFMTGRAGNDGYAKLDASVNSLLKSASPEVSRYSLNLFGGLAGACSTGNTTATSALNIDELIAASEIRKTVNKFVNDSRDFLISKASTIIDGVELKVNMTTLETVVEQAANIQLQAFATELAQPLINNSDPVFAAIQNISVMTSQPEERQRFGALVSYINSVTSAAGILANQQLQILQQLQQQLRLLNQTADDITKKLTDSHESLRILLHVEYAVKVGAVNLTNQVDSSVSAAVSSIVNSIGDCRVISESINSAIDSPCVDYIRPFNAFWFGMGLYQLCFVCCFILAIKLANLYSKRREHESKTLKYRYMTSNKPV